MDKKETNFIVRFLLKYKKNYIAGVATLVCVNIFGLMVPLIQKEAIDGIVSGKSKSHLILLGFAYLIITLFMALMRFYWRKYIFGTAHIVARDIMSDFFGKLLTLSQKYYVKSKLGNLMSLATNDVNSVRDVFSHGALIAADFTFFIITIPPLMFYLSPRLAAYSILPLFLVPIWVYWNEKKVDERYGKVQESFSKLSAIAQEDISGIRIIKAFSQIVNRIKKFDVFGKKYFADNMKLAKVTAVFDPTLDFMVSSAILILIYFGGNKVISNEMTLGTFIAFQRLLQMLVWPFVGLGLASIIVQQGITSNRRIDEVMNENVDIKDNKNSIKIKPSGKIEIKNLDFMFEHNQVLNNLNLSINKGEKIAIIGSVGSGKSTILNILTRQYEIPRDKVYFDNIDINDLCVDHFKKSIGFAPQEVFLFADTIANNIAFAEENQKIDLGKVEKTANISAVHKEILEIPGKYNAELGERGVNLSGGQKQRISIARALYHDPEIVIFDDVLSAVDIEKENLIIKNLLNEIEGKTFIIATHRLSIVQFCDKIIFLEKGKVKESGSFQELMNHDTQFKKLYSKFSQDIQGAHDV